MLGKILMILIGGSIVLMLGGYLAITEGSQYFWSQQYAHAVHRGSAWFAAVGITLMVLGIVYCVIGGKKLDRASN
jgi:hypothetical protein